MPDTYEDDWSALHFGDCLEVVAKFEPNTIDTIVTDPPYEINIMNRGWDRSGISFQVETWKAMLRVAKPGASLVCFGGSRTFHRTACAIEDAGWLIRDCLMWLYSKGFPKSQNISKALDKSAGATRKVIGTRDRGATALSMRLNEDELERRLAAGETKTADGRDLKNALKYAREHRVIEITEPATDDAILWDGWGTALKPAFEPIILAMKPLDGTFAQNAKKWGVAGLAIDAARNPAEDTANFERKTTHTGTSDGWKRPWQGDPDAISRAQASRNVSAKKAKEFGRWPPNVMMDAGASEIVDDESNVKSVTGGKSRPSRFFYIPKPTKKEKLGPWNRHPTKKPLDLMQQLCRLTKTPTGGIVLDPFAGSGTTLVAARLEGRKSIGIEKDPEWFPVARRRLIQSQVR